MDDVITYSRAVHSQYPNLRRILFGHSMGGCIALAVCIQQPDLFEYGIISAPTTARPPSVNAVLKALGGVVAKLGPKLRLTPLDISTLCRDPAVGTFKALQLVYFHHSSVQGYRWHL